MKYLFKTDLIVYAFLQMVKRGRVTVSKESTLMVKKDVTAAAVPPRVTQGKIIENICKVFEIQCNISIVQVF